MTTTDALSWLHDRVLLAHRPPPGAPALPGLHPTHRFVPSVSVFRREEYDALLPRAGHWEMPPGTVTTPTIRSGGGILLAVCNLVAPCIFESVCAAPEHPELDAALVFHAAHHFRLPYVLLALPGSLSPRDEQRWVARGFKEVV